MAKTKDKAVKAKVVGPDLNRLGRKFAKLKTDQRQVRDDLDEAIITARSVGMTYNEIAERINLSVAWVQNAVKRYTENEKKKS